MKTTLPRTILCCLGVSGLLSAGTLAQSTAAASFAPNAGNNNGVKASAPVAITLELVDTDIRDALRLVARQGGLSLVMSDLVSGQVSLELNRATIDQALGAIMSVGGLSHSVEGDVLLVSTIADMLARKQREIEYASLTTSAAPPQMLVLQLRYVDAERMQPMVQALLGENGTATVLPTSDHLALARSVTETADVDADGLTIGTRLSSTTQGQPAKSHTLVVFDVPERLATVESLVERVDVKPAQVLIEARFVEVTLDENHRLGIDWNILAGASGAATPHTYPFGDSSLGDFNPNVTGGSPGGVFPAAPNSVSIPGTPGLFTFGTLDFSTFSAVLEAMQRDANVEIVSSPRVTVGDRRTATILVGERFPILRANISDFGTVTEELERYEPIGVQLEVSPSILGDDEVELYVRPSTSSLGALVTGSTGLTVARINTRQIDTSVTARDKETVVLGGLITTRETEDVSSVPYLSRIPLLGRLFQHKAKHVERIDLVVFLTVTILNDEKLGEADRAMLERGQRASHSALDLGQSTPQY
ncbi:MAG: type IV pilus assembly protein PilQ [Chlamydiales bacterium]|jgi:type IV pilus assembly protein PilQ